MPVDKTTMMMDALRGKEAVNMAGMLSGDQYMSNLGSQNLQQMQKQQQFDTTQEGNQQQRRMLQNYYAAQNKNWEAGQQYNRDRLAADQAYKADSLAVDREKLLATQGVKINQEVAKLSDKMTEIVPIVSSVEAVDNLLAASGANEGGKIPGIGRVESALPQFALGERGQRMRSTLATVENMVLKLRSGAAVTTQEAERLKNEFSTVKNASEENFVYSWNRFKSVYNDVTRSVMARATPEAQAEYIQRSGFDPSVMAPKTWDDADKSEEQLMPWQEQYE